MIREWFQRNWLIALAWLAVSCAVLGSVGCLPLDFVHDVVEAAQCEPGDPWDELIDDLASVIHDELGEH